MKRIGRWAIAGSLALSGVAGTASAHEGHERKSVTIEQLPSPVRATFEREAQGGKIEELERETEKGRTVYEGEVTRGKHEIDLKVAEDGSILSKH